MKTFIYGLYDPREPKKVMYIGKSDKIDKRLACHISSARHANYNKQNRLVWIRTLLDEDILPCVKVLEECEFEVWKEREVFHIAKWREKNPDLTNMAKGGDDYHTTSTREERSRRAIEAAARLTPEQRSARSLKGMEGRREKGLPLGRGNCSREVNIEAGAKAAQTRKERGTQTGGFALLTTEQLKANAAKANETKRLRGLIR